MQNICLARGVYNMGKAARCENVYRPAGPSGEMATTHGSSPAAPVVSRFTPIPAASPAAAPRWYQNDKINLTVGALTVQAAFKLERNVTQNMLVFKHNFSFLPICITPSQ